MFGQVLLQHNENLSMTLQSHDMSSAGQKTAEMTISTLLSFSGLAEELDVNDSVLPCQTKRPGRFETGISDGSFPRTVEYLYLIVYFEALDLIMASSPALILGTGKTSLLN